MGVITYFLLAGYTPFDRDTPQEEMEAIVIGNYKFEPVEYWSNVSETAKDFVRTCLTVDPDERPTAAQALHHKVIFIFSPSCPSSNDKTDPSSGSLMTSVTLSPAKTAPLPIFYLMSRKRLMLSKLGVKLLSASPLSREWPHLPVILVNSKTYALRSTNSRKSQKRFLNPLVFSTWPYH
jgi:serine/threonine protein kinase